MDTRNGWIPDDPSHHITRCHPLLRLRHLRSNSDHRHLHGRTGSCSRPPLPRHWDGTRKFRTGSRERRCRGQRDNLPDDVLGRNLLASRNTARYHEDHSQLHAANVRERWTKRRVDLCATCPSPDQHDHSTGISGVFHCARQSTDELERRIVTTNPPKDTSKPMRSSPPQALARFSIKASISTRDRVE